MCEKGKKCERQKEIAAFPCRAVMGSLESYGEHTELWSGASRAVFPYWSFRIRHSISRHAQGLVSEEPSKEGLYKLLLYVYTRRKFLSDFFPLHGHSRSSVFTAVKIIICRLVLFVLRVPFSENFQRLTLRTRWPFS